MAEVRTQESQDQLVDLGSFRRAMSERSRLEEG